MRECLIVGRPNSGKTMFTLNFAAYLGNKTIDILFKTYDGLLTSRHFTIDDAKRELCDTSPHKTRLPQSIELKMPQGKTAAHFKLTDTCGVAEKIYKEETIRKGMAQTLSLIRCADFIIHLLDLTELTVEYLKNPANIDHEIYNYGMVRHNYIMLLNKIDLAATREPVSRAAEAFPQVVILPISARYSQGFKEVKNYVARNI
ncbi:Hypothetical protein LUCI_1201 [Lucifera butyrica]|uniref:G domain-containing protein n=1 Tax=Lucifera butyrica TaxID=1351585 RepID=A0A498R590_9FIRM|nr:GTPase domain-containing protein [Lucifera butyrica]VBB05990.1 Hypothetical protein LUCI_1201 [Lucifera butyrica]